MHVHAGGCETVIGSSECFDGCRAIALLAGGSVVGGYVGSHIGRRLPPTLLRSLVVIAGLTAFVLLLS